MSEIQSPHEEDKNLAQLLQQRQQLLKSLNEIDSKIRQIELKTSKKERETPGRMPLEIPSAASLESMSEDKITSLVELAMADQEGYRSAILVMEEAYSINEEASEEDQKVRDKFRRMFLQQVFARAAELMVDPYGNYFMQRLISLLKNNGSKPADITLDRPAADDESELLTFLDAVGTDLSEVSCNMHGTRTIQRLVDVLHSAEEFELFSELVANDLVTMIKDLNGNHTVIRLLLSNNFMQLGVGESAESAERGQNIRKDIYHIIAINCVDICVNRQGCCIIQRCLQSAPEPFRSEIVSVALNNVLSLVQDAFGNYVIQYILDLQLDASPEDRASLPNYTNMIIRQMLHHIAPLSCNKFGSNVIEKCLKSASADVRQLLIDELTDPHAMPKLLTDSFANYVIQTAISTASDDAQFNQIRDAIQPLSHLLKNSPYGVKVESKLAKRARELSKKNATAKKTTKRGQQPKQNRQNNNSQSGQHHHHHQHQQIQMQIPRQQAPPMEYGNPYQQFGLAQQTMQVPQQQAPQQQPQQQQQNFFNPFDLSSQMAGWQAVPTVHKKSGRGEMQKPTTHSPYGQF